MTVKKTKPYDSAFRTMVLKGDNLILPFINELFHPPVPFDENASVEILPNEQDSGSITDAQLRINHMLFHIECESTYDGKIVIRMVNYNLQASMGYADFKDDEYILELPQSGVLFLRKTKNTPSDIKVHFKAKEGEIIHHIPVLILSDYSLEDLFHKNLLFLIPFYLFNLERDLKKYDKSEDSRNRILSAYQEITKKLNWLFQNNKITMKQYTVIRSSFEDVTNALTKKNVLAREELTEIMSVTLLPTGDEYYYAAGMKRGKREGIEEGMSQGIQKGTIQTLTGLVKSGVLSIDAAAAEAESQGISKEELFKAMKK